MLNAVSSSMDFSQPEEEALVEPYSYIEVTFVSSYVLKVGALTNFVKKYFGILYAR